MRAPLLGAPCQGTDGNTVVRTGGNPPGRSGKISLGPEAEASLTLRAPGLFPQRTMPRTPIRHFRLFAGWVPGRQDTWTPRTGRLSTRRRAARAPKGSEQKTAEYAKVARLKAREADRRKDWCEKTSTMLARTYGLVRFEKLNIKNMTRSARGTAGQPGRQVKQKAGLNRVILAQGWGQLRQRTEHKAPGRVEDVPVPYTSLRCSACGWIDKNSRKSQAEFVCSFCGFTCNADTNAATNVAAGQGGIPRPRRSVGAGGMTTATSRSSIREPQPTRVGIPLFKDSVGKSVNRLSGSGHAARVRRARWETRVVPS
ncbi:RNA-guided endonuclease InsQ/TnpB family protein, partial [Streptomyces mirabilis]|uniref:RNA-guided endonuclease InsQ/TnpB family protein n=1 Tax=Streptomyces mirabilis TaxID=68239 RepID=UPI0036DD248C